MKNKQEIIKIVHKQHMFFNSSITHTYDFRINELKKLKQGIKNLRVNLALLLKMIWGNLNLNHILLK